MEYSKLGKTNIEISKITFGSWAIGAGKEWGANLQDTEYQKTIISAFESGINFFDTASGYGNGHSEILLGKTVKSFREKVIISSKHSSPSLLKGNAEQNVDASLKRLNTDYIDVFLVHWPSDKIDVRENIEQLMHLKEKGKIKSIGVSNYTTKHLKKALEVGQIDVIQPCYSLYWRQIEKELLPFCVDNDISVMTYSSMASGLLSGKFTKDWMFDENDMRNGKIALFKKGVFEKAIETNEKLNFYVEKYNKSLAQIAINWVINKKGITTAIVGAKTSKQVLENIEAIGWSLSKEDFDAIGDICMGVAELVSDWDTMYLKSDRRLFVK